LDAKYLLMLEFPKVREIIAGYTSFHASHELALKVEPLNDCDEIRQRLTECSEARHMLAVEHDFRIGEIEDIREPAQLAARGKTLEPLTLAVIVSSLSKMRLLRGTLNRVSTEFPTLWEIAQNITDMKSVERSIGDCITPSGELQDGASEHLSALRHQIRSQRQKIISNLETFMHSTHGQKIVQETIITEREGRYVIPVKIEAKKEIQGIIHDVSNTGATAFIEPFEAIDQGNELRELVNEEKREIERIMKELSVEVGSLAEEISRNVTISAQVDFIFAKAKYARRAQANEPQIIPFDNKHPAALNLIDARHPLLGDKAVPLSIEIGSKYKVLVITGPNTGGKTVTLKTIGLLSMMALAGLPIPASEESQIPIFDNIYVDIGDEQSIEQTLSTFSWHISNITHITRSISTKSLVLLDELGTSTDPAEGSALARAILLYFLSKNAIAVATTHMGDLKAFAYATPGLQNASLDFDPSNFTPTFHLTVGIPGGSNAISTAARLGLDNEIIEHARSMLSEGAKKVEALISNLTEEKDHTRTLRVELEKARDEAVYLNSELEKQRKELKLKEKTVIQETRDLVVSEAAELQREMRQASTELRKQKSKDSIEQTRQTLASVESRLKDKVWQVIQTSVEAKPEVEDLISIGDTVWLKDAELEAQVLAVREGTGEVEVQAGQTRIKLGLDGVEKVVKKEGQPVRRITVTRPAPKNVPLELLLLGKRAEEVEDLVNNYLDDASLASLSQVRIVHGSGTGVLREIVREMLAHHPLVKAFRPGEKGEGGNGVTVVKL